MRIRKIAIILALGFVISGYQNPAEAFHNGGVANCDGCHTMHNSAGGQKMAPGGTGGQYTANTYLLQGTDQSSTCLNCHAGNAIGGEKVATFPQPASGLPPVQLTPGGDFAWLQKNYAWTTSDGIAGSSAGERHGHSIIAQDFGFNADAVLTQSPGGSYPAGSLHCSSCHDPHGRYRITANPVIFGTGGKAIGSSGSYGDLPTSTTAVGAYRLLGGMGYAPASNSSYPFSSNPPIAVAPATYNRSEGTTDTRVAYGKGVSDWCANCHAQMHSGTTSGVVHPSGVQLGSTIASNYNLYVMTGSFNGTKPNAYTSMVPIQTDNSQDLTVLAGKVASTAGAESNDQVTCLTCHRAHASGWDSMTRWNNKADFLTVAGVYPGTDAAGEAGYGQYHLGRSQAEVAKTFYDRPASKYAAYQRLLCNKCHMKD